MFKKTDDLVREGVPQKSPFSHCFKMALVKHRYKYALFFHLCRVRKGQRKGGKKSKETDDLVQESRVSFFAAPLFPPAAGVDPFDSMVLASLFGRDLFRLMSTFNVSFILKAHSLVKCFQSALLSFCPSWSTHHSPYKDIISVWDVIIFTMTYMPACLIIDLRTCSVHHTTLSYTPTQRNHLTTSPQHTPLTGPADWGCWIESPSQAGPDMSRYFAPFQNATIQNNISTKI